jgi:hypothetical protein
MSHGPENETWRAGGRGQARDAVCFEANSPQNSRPGCSPQAQFAARQRLRRQRLVEHLHRLGPAPLGHFLTFPIISNDTRRSILRSRK